MSKPFNPGYYSGKKLKAVGFKSVGENVHIAKNCTIIGLQNIEIGDNVRIDGYCSIIAKGRGYVRLGSFVHIGSYCLLSAGDGIVMEDFSALSQGVRIYSRTDDYTGEYLTNPTIPEKYTGASRGEVLLRRHAIIGSGTIILSNVEVGMGSAVGALSLVETDLEEWGVYFGCPARRIKARSRHLLELEREFLAEFAQQPALATGLDCR